MCRTVYRPVCLEDCPTSQGGTKRTFGRDALPKWQLRTGTTRQPAATFAVDLALTGLRLPVAFLFGFVDEVSTLFV